MDYPDITCKIIFLGDAGVGKSSILRRYHRKSFLSSYESTIGVDFFSEFINHKGRLFKLQIWDTAGQERFNSLIQSYFKDSSMAIIVFDLTDMDSYKSIDKWIKYFNEFCNVDKPLLLVGNKCELAHSSRVVERIDVFKYIDENNFKNADYCEVSAKCEINLDEIYIKIINVIEELVDNNNEDDLKENYSIKCYTPISSFYLDNSDGIYKKKKCCVIM
tara:strand:+ start:496 stop:1149 length:654 start_codon:yes stop_codon:yes gene_type:complete